MQQAIGALALLVPDYDEAIDYYTQVLGFELVEDTPMGPEKRWVVVRPMNTEVNEVNTETAGGSGHSGCGLVLAKAKNEAERAHIGNQTGGRVFLFLHTDDFWRDYTRYRENGVRFLEEPRTEPYATVAVFEDRFGNRWDLLQKNAQVV